MDLVSSRVTRGAKPPSWKEIIGYSPRSMHDVERLLPLTGQLLVLVPFAHSGHEP